MWVCLITNSFLLLLPNKPEVQRGQPKGASFLPSAFPRISSQAPRYKQRFALFFFHETNLRPRQDLARELKSCYRLEKPSSLRPVLGARRMWTITGRNGELSARAENGDEPLTYSLIPLLSSAASSFSMSPHDS